MKIHDLLSTGAIGILTVFNGTYRSQSDAVGLGLGRETSGLTTEIAAKRADVSIDRLVAWEAGEQKPTFAQLRKLGTVYKRPLAIFYLEEPPKG